MSLALRLLLCLLLVALLGCDKKAAPLRTWRPADHAQPVSADPTRVPRQVPAGER